MEEEFKNFTGNVEKQKDEEQLQENIVKSLTEELEQLSPKSNIKSKISK